MRNLEQAQMAISQQECQEIQAQAQARAAVAAQRDQGQQPPQNTPSGLLETGELSQQELNYISYQATKMMGRATEQVKSSLRANTDPATLQRYQQQGIDPIFLLYRNKAMATYQREKQEILAQRNSELALSDATGSPL